MDGGWKLNNCALDFLLFYSDGLHLVEKGNLKVGKSVLKANKFNSNANPYKNAVWSNLNKCDFPPLPSPATRCKTIHSPKNMWVMFVNLSVVYLNHLLKVMNLFVWLSYLFALYLFQFLTVHCYHLLLLLRLMLVLLEFQLQPFPLT